MRGKKARALRAVARQLTTNFNGIQSTTHTTPKGLKFSGFRWPEGTFRRILRQLKKGFVK